MKTDVLNSLAHKDSYSDLLSFFESKENKSGFCYLRGRRRIGKSTLLSAIEKKINIFYFSGKLDESSTDCIQRMAMDWSLFSKDSKLQLYKKRSLTWEIIFQSIFEKAQKDSVKIAFDEIQWIAKNQSGFIGTLKNTWLKLESTKNVRIVICGSSNKFFKDFTGGEEQILRGLKTRSNINVMPLTLSEISQFYFPHFKLEQILFIFMITGGIPYYLNMMPTDLNFIQSLNKILFSKDSALLEEVDEVLRLEFNQAGIKTIKKIMSTLTVFGRNTVDIAKKSGIAPTTLNDSLQKLVDYDLMFEKVAHFKNKLETRRGHKFHIKDFYLNTYFQIIKPALGRIKKNNTDELLINSLFNWPQSFYYVENFTGAAFENLIEHILVSSVNKKEPLFKKMEIENIQFEVGTHWDQEKQIDLILHDCDDQQIRLIECKWTSSISLIKDCIEQLPKKSKLFELSEQPLLVTIVPIKATEHLKAVALKNKVILIDQNDLIDPTIF